MDLSIGVEFYKDRPVALIDPYDQNSIDRSFDGPFTLPYAIRTGERLLLHAQEEVEVPEGMIGLICLRSTWARLGLSAPPTVADPGFKGILTMEVSHTGMGNLLIRPWDFIWSVTMLPTTEDLYNGRYQYQGPGVTLPKALAYVKKEGGV